MGALTGRAAFSSVGLGFAIACWEHRGLRRGRGENDRLRDRADERELVQVAIALDVRAPGAARVAVAQRLHERVAVAALDNARLLVSELFANSLRHSDGPAGSQVIVSVELGSDWFRIGVQDSGSGAVITARTPDLETGAASA